MDSSLQLMMGDIQEIKSDTRLEDLRSENAKLTARLEAAQAEAVRWNDAADRLETEEASLRDQLAKSQVDIKSTQSRLAEVVLCFGISKKSPISLLKNSDILELQICKYLVTKFQYLLSLVGSVERRDTKQPVRKPERSAVSEGKGSSQRGQASRDRQGVGSGQGQRGIPPVRKQ